MRSVVRGGSSSGAHRGRRSHHRPARHLPAPLRLCPQRLPASRAECRPQIGKRRCRGMLSLRLGLGLDPAQFVLLIPLLPLKRGLGVPVNFGRCADGRRHYAAATCFNAISHRRLPLLACGQGRRGDCQHIASARTIPWRSACASPFVTSAARRYEYAPRNTGSVPPPVCHTR